MLLDVFEVPVRDTRHADVMVDSCREKDEVRHISIAVLVKGQRKTKEA
jgi:hypothetical protein